jgi:hypothetical protein
MTMTETYPFNVKCEHFAPDHYASFFTPRKLRVLTPRKKRVHAKYFVSGNESEMTMTKTYPFNVHCEHFAPDQYAD